MKKTIEEFNKIFTSKNLGLVGVDEELKQLKYAILTREHLYIEGEPGTAKSMLASRVFQSFKNSSLFSIHMNKEITDDAIFGPVDVQKYKDKGEYVRKTDGMLLDAQFAFFDELFDASEDTLRTLLGVLNERKWSRGKQIVNAKLMTAIATANYSIENEKTQAVVDRFIFKAKSNSNMSQRQMTEMFKNYIAEDGTQEFKPSITIDLAQVEALSNLVCSPNTVSFDDEILSVYYSLIDDFKRETNKFISNRVANKGLKVVKASALLNGRKKVNADDIAELKYVLCKLNDTSSNEKAVFSASLGKAVAILKIKDQLDEIKEVAEGIIKTDIMKLNPGELIKLVRGSKLYLDQIEQIKNTIGGKLPDAYEREVAEIKNKLRQKISKLQEEIDKITKEARATE